jgi:hypothetical protein
MGKPQNITRMNVLMGGDGLIITPDDSPELPDNIEEGVDGNGIVEGHVVETYYNEFIKLLMGDGYLRVVCDGGFTNVETRIPLDTLKAFLKEHGGAHVTSSKSDR